MLGRRSRPVIVTGQPRFDRPDSQLVSASQFYEPACRHWFDRIGFPLRLDRKCWEYSYILHAISTYGRTGPGSRGIAFGCGKEVLSAILAADGAEIVGTDYVADLSTSAGWEARGLNDLFFEKYIDRASFDARVSFRHVDMNDIPKDLNGFDFCWSTGSLEHIGGYDKGLAFVEKAMECLKPGGIAVHTTEFTLTSDTVGLDTPNLSFYCRADIEALASRLLAAGHMIVLNFDRGTTVADMHVDMPPFTAGFTLTAQFEAHVISSIGLIVQKAF